MNPKEQVAWNNKTDKQRMEEAEQFLFELQRGIPADQRLIAGYAKEATVQVDENGKKLNAGFWPVPYKPGKWIDPNTNNYICISSSIKTPNPRTGEMRYWRGEASFGAGLCLMVDDIGTGRGSKGGLTIEQLASVLPPTAIVETSPGNHQMFWFLDEPEFSMQRFKAFIRGFVDRVLSKGGDNTIKDVARYGRMPCGINNKRLSPDGPYKYPDANGKPFKVQLIAANYGNRYAMEAIARAFCYEIIVPNRRIVEVDREELALDTYWLKMAVDICSAAKMGEGGGGVVQMNMSGKYRIACPWGHEHTNGDPFGAYFRGPIPGAEVEFVFGCGHDTCRKTNRRTWATFVDELVLPKIVQELNDANAEWAAK